MSDDLDKIIAMYGYSPHLQKLNEISYIDKRIIGKHNEKKVIISEMCLPTFNVLDRSFEDNFRQRYDRNNLQLLEKLEKDATLDNLDNVSIEFIKEFIQQMSIDFINFIKFSQIPRIISDNVSKLNSVEKEEMLFHISDNKFTIDMYIKLFQQVSQTLKRGKHINQQVKQVLQNVIGNCRERIKNTCNVMVEKSEVLISQNLSCILTQKVKQSILQKLTDIEKKIIDPSENNNQNVDKTQGQVLKDIYKSGNNLASLFTQSSTDNKSINNNYKGSTLIKSRDLQNKSHSVHLQQNQKPALRYLQKLATEGRKVIGENKQFKENENSFMKLINRLKRLGKDTTKIPETQTLQEMVKMVDDYQRIIFLHNIVEGEDFEKILTSGENMTTPEKNELYKEIENYRSIIQKSFVSIENNAVPTKVGECSFRRYKGDKGKITHRHFLLNKDNLTPIFKQLDPIIFRDDAPPRKGNNSVLHSICENNQATKKLNYKFPRLRQRNIDSKKVNITLNNHVNSAHDDSLFKERRSIKNYMFEAALDQDFQVLIDSNFDKYNLNEKILQEDEKSRNMMIDSGKRLPIIESLKEYNNNKIIQSNVHDQGNYSALESENNQQQTSNRDYLFSSGKKNQNVCPQIQTQYTYQQEDHLAIEKQLVSNTEPSQINEQKQQQTEKQERKNRFCQVDLHKKRFENKNSQYCHSLENEYLINLNKQRSPHMSKLLSNNSFSTQSEIRSKTYVASSPVQGNALRQCVQKSQQNDYSEQFLPNLQKYNDEEEKQQLKKKIISQYYQRMGPKNNQGDKFKHIQIFNPSQQQRYPYQTSC